MRCIVVAAQIILPAVAGDPLTLPFGHANYAFRRHIKADPGQYARCVVGRDFMAMVAGGLGARNDRNDGQLFGLFRPTRKLDAGSSLAVRTLKHHDQVNCVYGQADQHPAA
jgi:hypothetical protein